MREVVRIIAVLSVGIFLAQVAWTELRRHREP